MNAKLKLTLIGNKLHDFWLRASRQQKCITTRDV